MNTDVLGLCQELAREGKTIGLAIHDINAAARYATYLGLLSAGHLVTQGKPEAVLHAAQLNQVFDVCTDRIHTADARPYSYFIATYTRTGGLDEVAAFLIRSLVLLS